MKLRNRFQLAPRRLHKIEKLCYCHAGFMSIFYTSSTDAHNTLQIFIFTFRLSDSSLTTKNPTTFMYEKHMQLLITITVLGYLSKKLSAKHTLWQTVSTERIWICQAAYS